MSFLVRHSLHTPQIIVAFNPWRGQNLLDARLSWAIMLFRPVTEQDDTRRALDEHDFQRNSAGLLIHITRVFAISTKFWVYSTIRFESLKNVPTHHQSLDYHSWASSNPTNDSSVFIWGADWVALCGIKGRIRIFLSIPQRPFRINGIRDVIHRSFNQPDYPVIIIAIILRPRWQDFPGISNALFALVMQSYEKKRKNVFPVQQGESREHNANLANGAPKIESGCACTHTTTYIHCIVCTLYVHGWCMVMMRAVW